MRISDFRDWLRAMREAHEEWLTARRQEPCDMDTAIRLQRSHNAMLAQVLEWSAPTPKVTLDD